MITTEEIAVVARNMLVESEVIGQLSVGEIDYERTDYDVDGIIVIPHAIDGEGSVRNGQVRVNIHVPDLLKNKSKGNPVYRTNFPRLIEVKKAVIGVLKNHFESGEGWNWSVGLVNPPMKEVGHNEHFVSIALDITVRDRTNNQ